MKYLQIAFIIVLVAAFSYGCAPVEEEMTTEEWIEHVNEKLQDVKMELAMENKYACCIQEGCNQCLLAHGSCPCYSNLQEGKPVCGECYAGWRLGEGVGGEFTPDDVKLDHDHTH